MSKVKNELPHRRSEYDNFTPDFCNQHGPSDFVLPLELVSWVALKGHRIPRLTAIATTTPVHWDARVPAGCRHRAWTGERRAESVQGGRREGWGMKSVSNCTVTVFSVEWILAGSREPLSSDRDISFSGGPSQIFSMSWLASVSNANN
ncbi:hypothetical protein EYF80_017440 [Liparis tanakae]|uniref:Uncharacterized protein n=1 Tax=Liparis tanakae TaxID=230148 RepID=A0A4Z2I2X7_9TELE|nr:hypothetical protein EYF80_017440 [Liparis tanakae]